MYFLALAADYDGTLAADGIVTDETFEALESLKKTGRKLLLVTGRNMESLKRAFPRLKLFDRVVAGTARCSTTRRLSRSARSPRRPRSRSSTCCASAASHRSRSAARSSRPGVPTRRSCSK